MALEKNCIHAFNTPYYTTMIIEAVPKVKVLEQPQFDF
jgi:hypothetical protein